MLKAGIVGLPNVGKSSLFNALTAQGAPSENYPFCTVDPNIGTVEVPDPRLDRIHDLVASRQKIPTVVQFVDIAGLVKGASEGEGLGNKFLGNIREVDAIVHVLRCFDDPDVTHVLGEVDPLRDREVVNAELALADLDAVETRMEKTVRRARSGEREAQDEHALLERLQEQLGRGHPVRALDLTDRETKILRGFQLLTAKPVLYLGNVAESDLPQGENEWTRRVSEVLAEEEQDAHLVTLCSAIESELAELDPADRNEFLGDLGISEPGLHRLIRGTYRLLGLLTFFTAGEKESRAWTVRRGALAPEAAGTIHSDFERGFIRAETIGFEEFEGLGSLKAAREEGRIRSEGKEYLVRDGDIMLFRFNV
ncbi:MAG: redox-regulated ATPase YchF [Gemmatimonadales bacterium]|nr:MAG: redox-regulated ATPase YchF [Gemmatimonadales bacterium]